MVIEIQPLQYGHSNGHTDICYSSDGTKLISCGGDGDVRIWNGFDDDDPVQKCLGEFVLCVQHKDEHILVGTDNNSVQLLEFPSGERNGILTRFTAYVNHIAVGENHNWVALASDDMTVKLMDITTKTTKTFSDLNGPPLSVSLCSNAKYLAVSCGDGKLKIYNTEDETVIKELNVVPKANSFMNAEILCRVSFDQKHNKYFAYPDKNKIVILNISDWSEAHTLSADDVTESFSITSFSHCGNYIAAVTLKGDIVVWNLRSLNIVGHKKHPNEIAITSINWNPKENGDLAFSDSEGYIGLATRCTNADVSKHNEVKSSVGQDADMDGNEAMEDDGNVDFGDIQIEEDDEDNENAVSLEKLKKDTLGLDSEANEDDDDKLSSRSPSSMARPRTPEVPLQQAFMPSSTPEHLDPRYLAWNEVGVIRCYGGNLDSEEGNKSIEVEFHDSTLHNSMMMANYQGYTMGSVSTAALAVANNTMINVVPLGSSTKEWHLNLPENEEIICIATSHNLVCFALESNLVHVCSIYGTQKAVVSIPGPIVCMSACSQVLMVAYHAAAARKNDQCIDVMLIKFQGFSVENHYIKSALSPGSKLQWMGFSDMGTPAMMDSAGMVYLYPLQANIWLPFCDTTKERPGPMDGFFVTAVYETYGTVRGIRCRGSMYPSFTPRPTVTEINIQAPFVELSTEKAQFESNLFMWTNLQIENTEKKFKEAALKTFVLAAKNNLDQRAVEFAEMLGNHQIVNLAMKYAMKMNKNRLIDRLRDVLSKLDPEEESNGVDKADVTISTPTNVIKPNKKLLVRSANKILAKQKGLSTPTNNTQSPTPIQSTNNSFQETMSTPTCSKMSTLDSQSLSILSDEPKNPFLKNFKTAKATTYNPLSLTDKFAGVEVEKEKENKAENEGAEKRKKPETSPLDKGKEKQRKLDRFMFSKRT